MSKGETYKSPDEHYFDEVHLSERGKCQGGLIQ